jgi:hypothetical protein
MGIDTLAEARAMSGFHSPLPKIFMGNATTTMGFQKNESHLPGVKTHLVWSSDGQGLRTAITEELITVADAIQTQIANCFEPGSLESSTATLALGTTVFWYEHFMSFVDKTYLDLT